ncbi:hypothetical protein HBE96_17400 [Clostridium sp. P21]|uniref:Lysozyme n=1 Tax=Clostridium muellerianum TaxID=2716538 RepID=A0A7Y0EJ29_9CLOT|nr:GH25 family lysozyme [Clostridium muellerianum]NMM64399.1 hypothetical protein [Clostridium muellerianum]
MLKGIDVYEGDDIEDFNLLKQNVDLLIQKATEGVTHIDSLIHYRYGNCKSIGIPIGFYHFASFNSVNPIGEAQHFLSVISEFESDTILWLDIEEDTRWSKQNAINYANQFINYVQSQGYKIGIYTGESFYLEYLQGNITDIPLWLAKYSSKEPCLYPNCSWQYSDKGQIEGIVTQTDLDYFQESILITTGGKKKVKNIVVYNGIADQRIAEYLADKLNCPTILGSRPFDYSIVEDVYAVGGGEFTSYVKQKFTGVDRFETLDLVREFIKTL